MQKKKIKYILFSAITAILLLIVGYFTNNQPFFMDEVFDTYANMEDVGIHLGEEQQDTDVVYINTAFDKELVTSYQLENRDGALPVVQGNTEITDRTKLYKFLSMLNGVRYKYLIIDVRFMDNLHSDAVVVDSMTHDTTKVDDKLFQLIDTLPNVVIATHSGSKLADSKLEKKAALADYYTTGSSSNFVSYEYFDSIPYIPLAVYNDLNNRQGKDTIVCHYPLGLHCFKPFAIYTQGCYLCYNSLFIDFGNSESNNQVQNTQERGLPFNINLENTYRLGHYCPVKVGKSLFETIEI